MKKTQFGTELCQCLPRVNLVKENGVTRPLFAPPTATTAGSPGIRAVPEIEEMFATLEGR